jgi:hypothetical protein
MKKNQDKRRSLERATPRHPDETAVPKTNVAGKKSNLFQITLVPLNLRSKF